MEFRTDAVFEAVRAPLALIEDEAKRHSIERYVDAARFPLERSIFDLLSGLVTAVDEQVQDRYRVRLTYTPGALRLEVQPVTAPEPEPQTAEWSFGDGDTEKVTIRIPAELKDLATRAAGEAGLSANSWFVRSLARSLKMAGEEMERRSGPPARSREDGRGRGRPHGFSPWGGPPPPESRSGTGKSMKGWIGD